MHCRRSASAARVRLGWCTQAAPLPAGLDCVALQCQSCSGWLYPAAAGMAAPVGTCSGRSRASHRATVWAARTARVCLMTVRPAAAGTVDAATGTRFVSGGVIRLLRSYPGPWEAHAMAANGSSQFLENSATEPGYKASFLDSVVVFQTACA